MTLSEMDLHCGMSWPLHSTSEFKVLKLESGVLTIIYLLRGRFQSQFVFGQRDICEVGKLFRCSNNHKLIEVHGSYEMRFASESVPSSNGVRSRLTVSEGHSASMS